MPYCGLRIDLLKKLCYSARQLAASSIPSAITNHYSCVLSLKAIFTAVGKPLWEPRCVSLL